MGFFFFLGGGEAMREGEGVYVRAMVVDEADGVAKEWNTGYLKVCALFRE